MLRTFDAALAYAAKHGLQALIVSERGSIAVETYDNGCTQVSPHALYSGAKSFWGTAALCSVEDGLIDLDAPVVSHIPEFKDDIRRTITPRMLLTMTAGYGFGGLGSAVPTYEKALGIPLKDVPGERFTYSGIPFQVFGAFFSRVLGSETPQAYLTRRILQPAGVEIATWRSLKDGNQPLPTGAAMQARQWLSYGAFILANRTRFAQAFRGTNANVRYGLGWWLTPPGLSDDVFYASGSGGQALYVIPARELIVAHFSQSTSYKHDAFLKRLLA
ncbi:MAG TPA: serine hydrolase domain-containing protein [Candidatus Aquilonibacter sp.]|nr:serine hydrolase domain-containing protein [Candidatus Aquilonibacter sp.]